MVVEGVYKGDFMGIVKRNNSKYWYVQFQTDNRTFIRSTKTTDKKLAEQLEAKWRVDIVRSEYLGVKPRIKLSKALQASLDHKHNLASLENLIHYSRVIQAYLKCDPFIDSLSNRDVEKLHVLMKKHPYAVQTIKHMMNFFRQTMHYANKMGYQAPILEYPKLQMSKGKLRYLSTDEEIRLLKNLDPARPIKYKKDYEHRNKEFNQTQHDHYDLVVLLLDTGARFSEIAKIEWSAINLEDKTIVLWRPKVRNESILYMTDRVYEILKRRKAEQISPFVFTNKTGGAMNYNSNSFRRIFKASKLYGVSMHTLRHTNASRLVQSGMSVYDVKEILGHTNIQTTMRYAHLERRDITQKAKDVLNILNLHTSLTAQ